MPTATYPSTLPSYVLQDGFKEAILDQAIESKTDIGGVPKSRRRYTKTVRKFNCAMVLTAAQRVTFETFWMTTLAGGTLPFDWVHPMTRATTTFYFRNPAPTYTSVAGLYSKVDFMLETA